MNYDKIGEFIQRKRKEKNLTQKELAKKIGVTDKAVSKWERGLGCPDVSILEALSDELGISILELLKGRKIEDEVIKVTEANDYIKETLDYSKNKYKRIINKMIIFMVFFITILLLFLNVSNIITLNTIYPYNFNEDSNPKINEMKESLNKLESNIAIINNNQGIYEDSDYSEIIKLLNDNLDKIKKSKIVNYQGYQEFKIKDLYMMDKSISYVMSIMSIIRIISKYDESKQDYYAFIINESVAKAYLSDMFYKNTYKSYKYNLLFVPNEVEIDTYLSYSNEIDTRILDMKATISNLLYLTKQIMEVGEIDE